MNKPRECYVACLDIMGFSEYVRNNSADDVLKYLRDIKKVNNVYRKNTPNISSLVFSDTLALWTPTTGNENENLTRYKNLLLNVGALQFHCMTAPNLKGLPLRGAITKGEFYFNDRENILFGKAWVEAVHLESKARYPRVIVQREANVYNPSFALDMGRKPNHRSAILRLDSDEKLHINYLTHAINNVGKLERTNFISSHKELVEGRMSEMRNSEKHFDYYRRVAEYHNWFCAGFEQLKRYEVIL
jgi:hypothetical protein